MSPRFRQILVLIALFAASALVRAWWLDLHAPLAGDEGDYQLLANHLLAGNGFTDLNGTPTAWRTPGLPVFLAVVYAVTGSDPEWGRGATFLISAMTTPLIYLLALNLFDRRSTALIAAGLWAFLPTSIFFSGSLYGEGLAAFLLAAAFLTAVAVVRKNGLSIAVPIVSGILAGAAVLTRGYLILVLAALPLYFLFTKRGKMIAVICLIFSGLLPAVWIARNCLVLGSPTLSTEGAQAIWQGNNRWSRGTWNGEWSARNSLQKEYLAQKYHGFFDELSETQRSQIYLDEAAADISAGPGRIIQLIPRKIFFFLTPYSYLGLDWLYIVCFPFTTAGVFLILRQKEKRQLSWLLLFPVVCAVLIAVLTFGDPRFRHPVDFCLVTLSSLGITSVTDRIKLLFQNY